MRCDIKLLYQFETVRKICPPVGLEVCRTGEDRAVRTLSDSLLRTVETSSSHLSLSDVCNYLYLTKTANMSFDVTNSYVLILLFKLQNIFK